MSKRLALLTTGGTIAMTAAQGGATLGDLPPFLQLLHTALPGTDIDHAAVFAKPSSSLSLADIAHLAGAAQAAAQNHDGVVITHGTDTLEETAFALELLTRSDTPIVITGAMRAPGSLGADGDANLVAAARVALHPDARGLGPLAVFDDEVHWAPLIRKQHASRTHAFSSAPLGPLGSVLEGHVRIWLKPARRLPHLAWGQGAPVIPILEVGPGFEPQLLESLRCDALVLSLPGGGHISDTTPAVLKRLATKIPVIFASRTGGGETMEQSYAYPGSEVDLLARGLVAAGPLDARKARVALAILLSNGASQQDIAAFFGSL
jgi:L-asparaginase